MLQFVASLVPFFVGHELALSYSSYNYGWAQLSVFLILFCLEENKRTTFLLSPSFIAVSYININFFIGSIVFQNNLVFDYVLNPYKEWENYGLVMGYFNLINLTILFSFFLSRKINLPFKIGLISNFKKYSTGFLIALGVVVLILFSFFEFSLDFLGGDGSFSMLPKTIGAIILMVCLSKSPNTILRMIGYLIIILFFSTISWENKRDAIFLLLPILLLESRNLKVKLNLKKVLILSTSLLLLLQLILAMSIFRGYGGYKPKNFIEANGYVLDYIKSKEFIPAFMNNLEISYTYFHSNNAVTTIIKEPENLTYGETLIKPIFIFLPRQLVSYKPRSIIHHYTTNYSKEYRNIGGSWPISVQSEMFWNFHFFGIVLGGLLFVFLNSIYLNIHSLIGSGDIINYVHLLYFYQTTLVLFRGSGLDMFTVFVILAIAFFVLMKVAVRLLFIKK